MARDPAQLLSQADKAYSSAGSGFSFFGSRTEKFESAAELYKDAANAYKVKSGRSGLSDEEKGDAGRQAGMAFEKAAMIEGTKLNEPDDMANTLQDAFKAYQKPCPEDAARCLSQAIDHYLYKGNFRRAATQKQHLAEHYDVMKDNSRARSAYADAAQWFEDDNAPALANKLNLMAAEHAAKDGDYLDAIKRFEHVAKQSVSSNTMRYSVKDYLLRAGVCHIAFDIVGAKRALGYYQEIDPGFPSTNEGQLFNNLVEAVERGDSEAFDAFLNEHYRLNSESPWFKEMYPRIKAQITEKEEDFS